jgi:hypothetical protein
MCTEAEKSGELCCKSAGRMVNILSNQLKRRFLVPDDGNELTMLQRHMLHFIIVGSMHQDIFQKDVEAEFQIRKSTATGILQLLEKKGFICRESVERHEGTGDAVSQVCGNTDAAGDCQGRSGYLYAGAGPNVQEPFLQGAGL